MFKNLNYKNILHWSFFIVLLAVSFSAIMNTTFYSKKSIMESFQFSFQIIELYEVGYADQLTIAKIERRDGWVFHFFTGSVLFSLLIFRFLNTFKKKKTIFQKSLYFSVLIMFTTGLPLYIRAFIDISIEIQNVSRIIHFNSAFFIGAIAIIHIFQIVRRENESQSKNSISKSFKFKNHSLLVAFIFLFTFSTQGYSKDDKHFEIAMQYYKGDLGGTTISKLMPNCPYDNCKKAELMKKKMNVKDVDGKEMLFIKKRDLKTALFFFEKSIYEDGNSKAIDIALKMLLSNLNYKDSKADEFLLKKLDEEFKIGFDEYKKKVFDMLIAATSSKSCYGNFKYAQFIEKEYLQLFKYDKKIVLDAYGNTVKICGSMRMESILASSKMQQLQKNKD